MPPESLIRRDYQAVLEHIGSRLFCALFSSHQPLRKEAVAYQIAFGGLAYQLLSLPKGLFNVAILLLLSYCFRYTYYHCVFYATQITQ